MNAFTTEYVGFHPTREVFNKVAQSLQDNRAKEEKERLARVKKMYLRGTYTRKEAEERGLKTRGLKAQAAKARAAKVKARALKKRGRK